MKLHQLQALVAVAEVGSIRSAARMLGLSHPAVTKALRELEAESLLPLLIRTAHGINFTMTGLRLLEHARLVVGQIERANTELAALRGEVVGRLSIAVTPWIMMNFLSKAVLRFHELMPGVQLEVFEGLTAVTLPRLREGLLDFAILPITPAMSVQEFDREPLFAFESCVIASRDHPCADSTSLHELLDQDWVVNYSTASYPSVMQNIFWQHGASIEPGHLHCVHSTALLFEMVRHAGMLSYCPRALLVADSVRNWVKALSLEERFENGHVSIITRRSALSSATAQCFVDCLKTEIKRRARSATPEDRELFDLLTPLF